MMRRVVKWALRVATALLLLGTAVALGMWASPVFLARVVTSVTLPNWPVEPVAVADNLYYVGGHDAAAYLLTDPAGHIIIDGGYPETAPLILSNIAKLGFRARDVKVILNSHGHFDHAGGIAALQKATGARVLASAADGRLMAAGGKGDFLFGDALDYPPVRVDSVLADGAVVTSGAWSLTAQLTPGHTPGCTSWSFTARVGGQPRNVLLICSVSLLPTPLVGNAAYPDIAKDFAATHARLQTLPCDIWLMPHGLQFGLRAKAAAVRGGNASAFVDPSGCTRFRDQSRAEFAEKLADSFVPVSKQD